MTDNPQILGTTESLISGFYVRKNDGSKEEDYEVRELVRRKFEHLRIFLQKNSLTTKSIIDIDGKPIDIPLNKLDITDEGFQLLQKKLNNWLDSKGSDANPPKMTMLEKTLKEIRNS